METTLYSPPDGLGEIHYYAQARELYACNQDANTSTTVAIGPKGLRELASKLQALADTWEGA